MVNKRSLYVMLLILAVLALAVIDYISLPAWTLQSFDFWVLMAIAAGLFLFLGGRIIGLPAAFRIGLAAGFGIVLVAVVISMGSWLIWPGNSERYYNQLSVHDADLASFAKDFPDGIPPDGKGEQLILPRTDKELSVITAQGKMGSFGARFQMNMDIFTSLSVERNGANAVLRVSPLDYTSNMVALSAGSRGTEGYIEVNQITEEGDLVSVAGGMKYTPGALFNYDLDRHLRFRYRSALFGKKSFEIDDAGKPWWVVPVFTHTIGLFGGEEQKGLVLADPVTGDTQYFDRGTEPSWIDRCISTELALTQANNHLRLKNGWLNLVFGERRDVFQLSDSYNYVVTKGLGKAQTWLVSGVTSPSETDQTLVGFMMINLRTRECRQYAISGITEMRAMEIAQNDERVRAQSLEATWPIITEVGNEAAFFLFLKNNVQRQRFVYIDVATGHKVAMGETIEAARLQFAQMLGSTTRPAAELKRVVGTVLRIRNVVKDDTILFLLSGDTSTLYTVDAGLSNSVRFLTAGDRVDLVYRELPSTIGRRMVTDLRNLTLEE